MRYFTNAAQNYVLHYSDYYASEVEKCLRTVDSQGDYSNFMQSSNASVQFYVSLHEYLQNLQSQSPGVWFAVSFLRKISNNRCFINDLVTSFRFIPVLSKFLGIQNNEEDLLNLLTLLSNLTYGIHVSWQDSYLPDMLFTLSDILLESPSVDLKSKSLMVISNLCYKNPAALHILISKVPTNKFIKCITALNCDGSVQLQVLKMLVIFEEMKGQLPDCEILNFADVAFNCIISAFQKTDAYALQQVVDFFTDINDNPSKHEVLKNYPKTLEDTKKLLDLIEGAPVNEDSVEACVGILFSFLPTIFKLRIKKTTQLFPRLFKVSTPWIDREKTCVQVLNVLRMTVVVLKDSTIIDQDTIINLGIITVLPHLITRFKSIKDQKTLSPLELAEISVLVSLLGELLSSNEVIRSQITDAIDTNTLHQIVENVVKKKEVECNALIIDIVSFVHTMTFFNEEWTDAFKSYLSNQHVLAAISLSLSQDSKQTKMKALSLLSSTLWDDGARKRLCECLVNKPNVSSSNNVCAEIVPSVFVYESRVSELLSNLDGQIKTSAVMELYEYKLAAVEHSNKRLLDAANAKSNALHHQVM